MNRCLIQGVAAVALVIGTAAASAQDAPRQRTDDAIFARVGETVVTQAQFRQALAIAQRKKYYHAKPPESEFPQFQREVGDDVVNRVLLVKEARRRGIEPERERIRKTLAGYEARYKGSPLWEADKGRMREAVTAQLETESLLAQLERSVRNVAEPAEGQARAYYDQHRDRFVEPEQVRLAVILLKVDPSSAQPVWNAARAEAKQIHKRLLAGADFGDLARLHSADRTAERGGDMGYVHRGMLPEAVHGVVDGLAPGQFSEPVQLLEGVALLRLADRKVARQRPFEEVRERAGDLWQREQGDAAWKQLIADLRKKTAVWIDESVYVPLPASPATAKGKAG